MTRLLLTVPALLVYLCYWVVMAWPLLLWTGVLLCRGDLDLADRFVKVVTKPADWADRYVPIGESGTHVAMLLGFALVELFTVVVLVAWRMS